MFLSGVFIKTKQSLWDDEYVEMVQPAAKQQQWNVGENKGFNSEGFKHGKFDLQNGNGLYFLWPGVCAILKSHQASWQKG